MRISDWSSDVGSSDLRGIGAAWRSGVHAGGGVVGGPGAWRFGMGREVADSCGRAWCGAVPGRSGWRWRRPGGEVAGGGPVGGGSDAGRGPGDEADGDGGPRGYAGLCRGGMRQPAGAFSVDAGRTRAVEVGGVGADRTAVWDGGG